MTLEKLEPCCNCPEHQRIFRNEDGWVLTTDFEAWMPGEWKRHCARYAPKAEREAEIVRRAETESPSALAREYGLSYRTVYRYIEKHRRAA